METEALDLRGLKCPLPALLARRHLKRAPAGAVVLLLTDDPMAPIDVPHMCRSEGFDVLKDRMRRRRGPHHDEKTVATSVYR